MLCGRWESFPREFAKCRRCRKAKYCGKECQSTAWSEGHRFWCSAKDPEEEGDREHHHHGESSRAGGSSSNAAGAGGGTTTGASRAERREARERDRQARAVAAEARLAQEGTGRTQAQGQGQNTIRVTAGPSTAAMVPTTQGTAAARPVVPTATGSVPVVPVVSPAPTARNANANPLPVLAAALADGTWTYRPGNPPPPQWPEMQEDLTRRLLARQLTIVPEQSRVDRMEREEREERERMEAEMAGVAGPSRVGQEDADVDMMID